MPGAGEVLIDVAFAGVNPVDWKLLSGAMREMMPIEFPFRPGCDGAGTVQALGVGATGLSVGQRVAFNSPIPRCKAMAGQVAVPANTCASVPDNVDFKLAAGLPVVAETAQQALFESGGLRAGQTVLIHGASGAVGCCRAAIGEERAGADRCSATASGIERGLTCGCWVPTPSSTIARERFEDRVAGNQPRRRGPRRRHRRRGDAPTGRSPSLKRGGRVVSVAGIRPMPPKPKKRA